MTDTDNLFREEVVARHFGNYNSATVIYRARLMLVGSLAGALLFITLLWLLMDTRYKETTTARGILEADGLAQRVVAPVAAVLQEIHVEEGQTVRAGQVVAILDRRLYTGTGISTSAVQIAALRRQRQLLEQQERTAQQWLQSRDRQVQSRLTDLRESESLQEQGLALIARQSRIAEEQLVSLRALLENAAVSRADVNQQLLSSLDLQRQQQTARSSLQQWRSEAHKLEQEHAALLAEFQLQKLQRQQRLAELQSKITSLREQDEIAVVASAAGTVAAIAVQPGQPVNSNQTLVQISADQHAVRATIYAPSSVVGQLLPGEEVMLRFDAFNFRHYGRYTARIEQISRAAIDPREQLLPVPGINEPVFRITARLDQYYVEGPDIFPLQAGLLFSADFVLQESSLIRFIFKPVLSLRGKIG